MLALLPVVASLSLGSVAVVANGGVYTQPNFGLGVLPIGAPSVEWSAESSAGRLGVRATVAAAYLVTRNRVQPVAGELVAFGQLHAIRTDGWTLSAGISAGVGLSLFCSGDVCSPLALRPGLELEVSRLLSPGVEFLVRTQGALFLSFAVGVSTLAGVGVRF